MIATLVVEDDFRVARLHAEAVERVPGFEVVACVHTASAALDAVRARRPDLVLLDVYLPDASGLEVLRRLRALAEPPDVFVLTAARDMSSVRAALRGSALHYLIKPFDFGELATRLTAYAKLHAGRGEDGEARQADVDRLFSNPLRGADAGVELPKGHSPATTALVLDALREATGGLSAADVSARVGISRATARRYLASLADTGRVVRRLRYGTTGRPEHRFEALGS